jgi:hypothetical protein
VVAIFRALEPDDIIAGHKKKAPEYDIDFPFSSFPVALSKKERRPHLNV